MDIFISIRNLIRKFREILLGYPIFISDQSPIGVLKRGAPLYMLFFTYNPNSGHFSRPSVYIS